MQEVFIGAILRQRRQELKVTQEDLCRGICESSTLSRVESGKQSLSKLKLDVLLQRLGLSGDRYYAFLSREEKEVTRLCMEIAACNRHNDYEIGLQKLEKLQSYPQIQEATIQQFILTSKTVLGKKTEGKKQVSYTEHEQLDLLMKAISLTQPQFSIESLEQRLYGIEEIRVIDRIAQVYSRMGNTEQALEIYPKLFSALFPQIESVVQYSSVLLEVGCHYAQTAEQAKLYCKAEKIACEGKKCCIQQKKYYYLPDFLEVLGKSYFYQGQKEKGEKILKQAYYLGEGIHGEDKMEFAKSLS